MVLDYQDYYKAHLMKSLAQSVDGKVKEYLESNLYDHNPVVFSEELTKYLENPIRYDTYGSVADDMAAYEVIDIITSEETGLDLVLFRKKGTNDVIMYAAGNQTADGFQNLFSKNPDVDAGELVAFQQPLP